MTDQKLVDELEKALRDEAYDGGFGYVGDEQFTAYVRTLAEAAAEVVEKALTPTEDERVIFEAIADRLGEHSQARNFEIADSGEYETKLRGPVDVEVLAEWLLPTVLGLRRIEATPTDEREALISAAHKEADQRYGATDWTDGPGSSTFRRVDRGKAGAFVDGVLWRFRRSEVPEPNAEARYEHLKKYAAVAMVTLNGDRYGHRSPSNREAAELLATGLGEPEPQGEPSDALNLVIHAERVGTERDDPLILELAEALRAALRAAGGVR